MNTRYFCALHLEKLLNSETEAIRCWSTLMQRGVKAYVECRTEAAHIYLGAALEIAMLRHHCKHNQAISTDHVTKPAEFLLQLFLVDDAFDQARALLNKIKTVSHAGSITAARAFDRFLTVQYETIEVVEKAFFGSNPTLKTSHDKPQDIPNHQKA